MPGIPLSANFDLGTGIPLDSRLVQADITALDSLDTVTQRYEGMPVFVVATGKNYQLRGGVADANWVELVDTGEPALGNPGTNGYVLSSTTAGVRSWVAQSSGVVPVSDILYWDSTNSKYIPYATQSAGKFYSDSTAPVNTNRLNYDGDLYVHTLFLYDRLISAPLYLDPHVADSAGAVAYTFDTVNLLSTAGALILRVGNQGSVRFTVDKDGNVNIPTGATYKINSVAIVGMTYPGAGIANSTGSAWGTSYTTSGTGTVVTLATAPTLLAPITIITVDTTVNPAIKFRSTSNNAYGLDFDQEESSSGYLALYSVRNSVRTLGLVQSWSATSNARIGIGITAPQTYLHVSYASSVTPLIYFGNNAGSGGYGQIGWDSGGSTIGWIGTTYNSDSARFDIRMKGTAAANAVVSVLGSGRVGIGVAASLIGQLSLYNSTGVAAYVTYTGQSQAALNCYYIWNAPYTRVLDIVSDGPSNGTESDSIIRFLTTPLTSGSAALERMRILGNGNVGIGIDIPITTLVIAQPGISYVPTLGTSPTRGFSILGSGGLYGLYSGLTNTGDAWMQVMRNDSAVAYSLLLNPVGGNVGIGIGTTPSTLLHLKAGAPTLTLQSTGAGSVATPVHRKYMFTDYNNAESGSIDMLDQVADTWRADMVFKTRHTDSVVYEDMRLKDGTMTIRLLATGSLTSASGVITSSSDQTLKTLDGFIDTALDKVMQLTPRYFYWNEKSGLDTSIRQLGFYAQEVNKALGEEVANTPEEGKSWGIYDRGIIAMLVKAVQELVPRLERLEKLTL